MQIATEMLDDYILWSSFRPWVGINAAGPQGIRPTILGHQGTTVTIGYLAPGQTPAATVRWHGTQDELPEPDLDLWKPEHSRYTPPQEPEHPHVDPDILERVRATLSTPTHGPARRRWPHPQRHGSR